MIVTARKRSAFSLIELVIVVVIIGIIAAIAIPRMSRGAAGANDSTLRADLAILRKAIDLYAAEHGGQFPKASVFSSQLTQYTDSTNSTTNFVSAPDLTHIYGPYLKAVPALPVGATNKGSQSVTGTGPAGTAAGGWYYDETTGNIYANTGSAAGDSDAAGTKYNTY